MVVALVVEGGEGVVTVFAGAVAVVDDGGVDEGGEEGGAGLGGWVLAFLGPPCL